jgi:hypothetical protein
MLKLLLFLLEILDTLIIQSKNILKSICIWLIVSPFAVTEEYRTVFQIVLCPFVNSFNLLIKSVTLLLAWGIPGGFRDLKAPESLFICLFNVYKVSLSFFMAFFFLVMYVTAYTYVGLFIYQLLPILAICVFQSLLDAAPTNSEGFYTAFFISNCFLYLYLTLAFCFIPTSCLVISLSAKIPFLRSILIDTIGLLSYKLYVGENPGMPYAPFGGIGYPTAGGVLWTPSRLGKKAGALWVLAAKFGFSTLVFTAGLSAIDSVDSVYTAEQIIRACREAGLVLQPDSRMK